MIIQVAPEQLFEVPIDADFTLRFKTPFSSVEMADATALAVEYVDPNKTTGSFAAAVDSADMVLLIHPGMVTEGLWEINPVFTLSGKKYAWALAAGMNVLARGVSHVPRRNQPTAPFQ